VAHASYEGKGKPGFEDWVKRVAMLSDFGEALVRQIVERL
jgi:hypothetical protein